jgi:competence protein ComEA
MRAGLVFVLASLILGSSIREWGRAHETRLRDLVDRLAASEDAQPAGSGGAGGVPPESTVAPEARPPQFRTDRKGSVLHPAALDPDRASAAEWERLPGIGPTLARRIVTDRATRGPFRSVDGLLRVRGIGPKTLERIHSYLRPAAPESLTAN